LQSIGRRNQNTLSWPNLLNDLNLFKGSQVLLDVVERYRAVDGGNGVAYLPRGAFAIHEVQRFVSILTTRAPQPLKIEETNRGGALGAIMIREVVIAEGYQRAIDVWVTPEHGAVFARRYRQAGDFAEQPLLIYQKRHRFGAQRRGHAEETLH